MVVLLLLLLVMPLKEAACCRYQNNESSNSPGLNARRWSLHPCTPASSQVFFEGPGSIVVDMVSLFPTENVKEGVARGNMNPYPFRADLLGALKDLKPA